MNFTKNIHGQWSCFLDLIYPRTCVVCQKALYQLEEHICINCELLLPVISENGNELEEFKSRFYGRISIDECYSYLRYEKAESVKRILKEIKYKGNEGLAAYMGEKMGQHFKSLISLKPDLIIPVPLHPKKEKLRGFNQSELIASGFSTITGIPYDLDVVIRNKNTKTQTQMDRNERWENVRTIFKVINEEKVKNRSLIILDDVVTTGSTLESMAESLKKAGASSLNFAVLAMAI